jgi:hypothetical protein
MRINICVGAIDMHIDKHKVSCHAAERFNVVASAEIKWQLYFVALDRYRHFVIYSDCHCLNY